MRSVGTIIVFFFSTTKPLHLLHWRHYNPSAYWFMDFFFCIIFPKYKFLFALYSK